MENLFFAFFHGDNFAAFIESAIWANGMRQAHLTAVAAHNQVASGQRIVRTSAVTAALGKFSFW
jgi:hypothetical protein